MIKKMFSALLALCSLVELGCFLWWSPEQAVEKSSLVTGDLRLNEAHFTSLQWDCRKFSGSYCTQRDWPCRNTPVNHSWLWIRYEGVLRKNVEGTSRSRQNRYILETSTTFWNNVYGVCAAWWKPVNGGVLKTKQIRLRKRHTQVLVYKYGIIMVIGKRFVWVVDAVHIW